jgi:hypothetical protein
MSMKKPLLAMLTAALLATMLAGCSDSTSSNAENKQKQNTPELNTSQPKDAAKTNQNKTPDISDSTQAIPDSTDASHLEIRDAFNLSGYRVVSPVALGAIAMGKIEMPLDEKQRLTLAKAVTAAISDSKWEQKDQPPGIFLRQDGGSFAIGIKRANGDLTLNLYDVQPDGSWKLSKQDTKPGKK